MARIRRTSKTNGGTRRTTTISSKGRLTQSTSQRTGTGRITHTVDNEGRSYTTRTTRFADGSWERERLGTKTPVQSGRENTRAGGGGTQYRPSRRRADAPDDTALAVLGMLGIGFAVVFVLLLVLGA